MAAAPILRVIVAVVLGLTTSRRNAGYPQSLPEKKLSDIGLL